MSLDPSSKRESATPESVAAKPLRWLLVLRTVVLAPYYVVLGLIKFFRQGY